MIITLINPPGLKSLSGLQMHSPNPPLGLAYIAGTLKASGLAYHVIDAVGENLDQVNPYPARHDLMVQGISFEEIVGKIPSKTDIIGITCMFSTLWPLSRMVAAAVRARFPDSLIVLGGEHGTAVPDVVLESSVFDVVILGEGEETFINLVTLFRQDSDYSNLPGIAFRKDGQIIRNSLSARNRNVDEIAEPDWDSFPIEEYIRRHQTSGVNLGRSMPILSTRGCPYRCTFCSSEGMWTTRYIPRNHRLVVDEMEKYISKYNVSNFDFQDLTAIVKRRWVVEFCNEIIKRDLNITWQMPSGTRAEIFDKEVADLLYRAGCRALAFAPESGAPEMLKAVKKQVDLDNLLVAAKIALNRGLKLSCFIVIGFPNETAETLKKTMSLIRKLSYIGVYDVAVSKFVPYPGSALFRQLQDEKKIKMNDDFFVSPMDFYTQNAPSYAEHVSTKRLYWTMIWMFVNFYVISFLIRPNRVIRILANAILKGKEETRYAKWLVDRIYTRRRWRKMSKSAG